MITSMNSLMNLTTPSMSRTRADIVSEVRNIYDDIEDLQKEINDLYDEAKDIEDPEDDVDRFGYLKCIESYVVR